MLKLRFALLFVVVSTGLALQARASAPPPVGSLAPNFTLTSNEGKQVTLSALRGQWVVLYFYPKDFTSGCTTEAHNFQRDLPQYEKAHAVIVGVSVQDVESHKSFCTKEGLHFRLLADIHGDVSKTYDSTIPVIGLSARHTFLIDPSGKIVQEYLKVNPGVHSQEVLADLARLQR